MNYEDFDIGDIVCAKTTENDIDVKTLGMITKKLPKSDYESMRVICVSHYYDVQNNAGFGCFAPRELIKLSTAQLYHIMRVMNSWKHFENIKIKR